jgi:hypothetical protein
MSEIIQFKPKTKKDTFRRIDELFHVTMWIGTGNKYEIDMKSHENYTEYEIFTAIGALYATYGIENNFISADDDNVEEIEEKD